MSMLDWLRLNTGFEIGAAGPITVREEIVVIGLSSPVTLLYVSDLHLGSRWSGDVVGWLSEIVRDRSPTALLLGGDIADSESGIRHLRNFLSRVGGTTKAFVLGNHDQWSHRSHILRELSKAKAHSLIDGPLALDNLSVHGSVRDVALPERSILCTHDPADFEASHASNIRLTLAGHLHGGQCVLWEKNQRQYPGALFNRWTCTRLDMDRSTLLVSRGVADSLPVRFRCPREVLLVRID